ncbi:MAG: hypothetical protein N2C14_20350, partial [Planctomycetales bacterium]
MKRTRKRRHAAVRFSAAFALATSVGCSGAGTQIASNGFPWKMFQGGANPPAEEQFAEAAEEETVSPPSAEKAINSPTRIAESAPLEDDLPSELTAEADRRAGLFQQMFSGFLARTSGKAQRTVDDAQEEAGEIQREIDDAAEVAEVTVEESQEASRIETTSAVVEETILPEEELAQEEFAQEAASEDPA